MSMIDAIAMALLLAAPPSADELREAARERFDEGRFAEAAVLLEDLYAIDPQPQHLYSRGQALRLAGDCAGAIGALDAFIATGPPAPDVEDAERWIARCREHLGNTEEPEPQPASSPPSVVVESPPPLDAPPPRVWHHDPAGGVLLGIGLAGIATGAGLVGGSFALARDERDEPQADHFARQRSVDRLSAAGWSVLGLGSALVVGAIIRYAIVHRSASR